MNDYYPEIERVLPVNNENNSESFSYMGHHLYKGLNIKIPYTGKILVGDEFLPGYYIHMGYQRAWAYKVLNELVFVDGMLIETNDQSKIAAKIRERINNDNKFENGFHLKIPRFVTNSFSLEYDTKIWWL